MVELGQLEKHWQEFHKKNVRVVVVSIEGPEDARATQADFPHLVVVSDANRKLSEKLEIVHPRAAPNGDDALVPTTLLIDGEGEVRWVYRSDNVFSRLSPGQLLAAIDEKMPAE